MKIWKSVVGKLWITILILVSFVLLFLTILLLQFFENFHLNEVEKQMTKIATKISEHVTETGPTKNTLLTAAEITDTYSARTVIIDHKRYWQAGDNQNVPKISPNVIKKDLDLKLALSRQEHVVKQGNFAVNLNGKKVHRQMMVVGVPIKYASGEKGAVYVFQSLNTIQKTINQSKKLIYISAGIAIILTTFFAFFLSTRIASPLSAMRKAAIQVAKGHFDLKVPVLTHDDMGELAKTFNQMAQKLKVNLTALNQEKEQLSRIINSMADGVMTFDRQGQLVISNPPARILLHSWRFENKGQAEDIRSLPHTVTSLFQHVVTNENKENGEINFQGRSWVIVMSPLYDQDKVRGAVAVLRDMTEERQLDQLRKGFIANVSHELKTPIAMLQGYSEAIIDNIVQTPEEMRELTQIIHDESLRMGRLVNELLDLAKLEAGHFQLNQTLVNVDSFFSRVVNKFQNVAKESGITLVFRGPSQKDYEFECDPDRIEQVLTNLIDNAIRHTKEGNTVTVEVEAGKKGIYTNVVDTGVGISEEDLPFVFERFYKADKARTRGKSGTGLGLSIAKNIVKAHGGGITVNSKKGEGTTFTFFLPKNASEKV
ncbi:HAMP domain-containing protein [Terrilactibacillus sp. BCM23-1]|uniref:histidine kinase n=1 Tax=Terrilactibacillus tamarindi TaxID=2599694 RepID=A0A6N8CMI8_9BACI|nr:ATP-binding protein [Terrilactibacillus tamarindi]MTT31242.1 HAMP domain-containing protein [Terrilactibacillus tamarindi]